MTNSNTVTESFKYYIFITASVIMLLLGATTFTRNKVFHSEVTLWSDVIKKSPQKARSFNNLGRYYLSAGDYRNAVNSLSESISRDPFLDTRWIDIAIAYERSGDFENAKRSVRQAIKLTETAARKKTKYHIFLGDLHLQNLELLDALKEFTTAVKMEPENDYIYHKMGLIFRAQERYDEAIAYFKKALELSPEKEINKAYVDEVSKLKSKHLEKQKPHHASCPLHCTVAAASVTQQARQKTHSL